MKGRTRTKLLRLTNLVVCICLSYAELARADVVSDWNAIASQTAIPVRPGPSAILDLAMVHTAMHDAIQAFVRGERRCRVADRGYSVVGKRETESLSR